ncbi:MAG: NADH-quinone oxidoreductase subunit M [Deltaproteobacteria bacterium]|nr:NADH-quinone oxidoreductase subunit M [Deltaproteobacteria bacterium]
MTAWLSLVVWAPFAAALVLLLLPARASNAVRLVAVTGAGTSLAGAIAVALSYDRALGGVQFREYQPLVPSLGIAYDLGVDGWGVCLILLTGLIIFAGTWATWTLKERPKEYYILLLALVTGVFGVFSSLDLFLFFLFYELAVLPMYLLIGIWGSSKAIPEQGPFAFAYRSLHVGRKEYAAMKLTLMLLLGSALILAGILTLYWAGDGRSFSMEDLAKASISTSTQRWLFPALWLGFGTLAGVFPFHTWSPDGHASAPTATSMLHAGVLMKLGAYGVIRVGMVLLPEGAQAWAWVVGVVAVINVVYGALSAMRQTDLKYIVAYSSVSHMGVVMLGAATLTVDGWNGAVFQMFAHGIMTGLLFALVGLVYEKAHDREIFRMGGFGKVMPGIAVAFTLAALSSLGMPGSSGFVAEFLVFLGAFRSHPWWAVAGILGAWITAVYVLRAVRAIFWGPGPDVDRFPGLSDARGPEWVALYLLGLCIALFGLWPGLILDAIDSTTLVHLGRIVGPIVAGGTP